MIGRRITEIEAARDVMRAATDIQRVALAIELAASVTDPRQAEGLLRLGRTSTHMAEIMIRERFVGECG